VNKTVSCTTENTELYLSIYFVNTRDMYITKQLTRAETTGQR